MIVARALKVEGIRMGFETIRSSQHTWSADYPCEVVKLAPEKQC
jgi:hypothetical protein